MADGYPAKAPEADKLKIMKAAENVDKILQGRGGKLQIAVGHLKGRAPDTEVAVLKALIAELQQSLGEGVEISLIIQKLDSEGNFVGKAT